MFNIYATDYAPVDPITPPCDITPIFIGYKGENKARCLIFDLTECVETFGDGGFVISFIRQGDDLPYLVTDTDRLDNNAIWIITDTDTAVDGYGMVQLQYIVDDVVCKSALYRTVTFDSNSITGDVPDPYEDLLAQIAAYAAQAEGAATTATAAAQTATTAVEEGVKTERSQRIAADEGLNTRINELMGLAGAPSMANSAAAMTDSSKVYVYTGNEAGYLTGHWYYYNGTEWADGGVYQATAINTDKTLTVENMAADAAVVGDKIDECMAAFVTETVSGSIASFADGADGVPLKALVVNISPVQSGTGDPSPSNVRAISGFTAANVFVDGKNILRYRDNLPTSTTVNGITYTVNADGSITINGTATATHGFSLTQREDPTPLKPGMTYHFRLYGGFDGTSGVGTLQLYVDTLSKFTSSDTTFTMPDSFDACYLRIRIASGTVVNNATVYPMVTVESQWDGGEYEQYKGTKYPVSFGTAGTVYGGTLDVTTGMLTVTHYGVRIGDLTVFQAFKVGTYTCIKRYNLPHSAPTTSGSATKGAISSMGVENTSYYGTDRTGESGSAGVNFAISTGGTLLAIYDSDLTLTASTFDAKYNDDFVVYPLAQPISVQLDPVSIASLLGNNNIFADTGSVASCEYRADTKLYLEKLTNPDDDMVANANITSGSYFMVNNNLYLATANIANGGNIIPGTNCTATNLAAALNAINS